MPEKIAEDIYRLEVPLPGNPLKSLNAYLIKGKDRNLIIDSGLNKKECREAMDAAVEGIGMDLAKTDFFITHFHADHSGLVASLATESSRVYLNRPDAEVMGRKGNWERAMRYAAMMGFPEEELDAAMQSHPGFMHGGEKIRELILVDEGDVLSAGGYRFTCIATPGHTRGHTCLYEPKKKIFVSGDHILNEITPNIQLWSDGEDPLKEYMESLDKVYRLDVELVLPGHRGMITNLSKRILELKEHYKRRLDEVLQIIKGGPKDAYGTAAEMTWDIECRSWKEFPVSQRWFATGEAIAHLKCLQERGKIRRGEREERFFFVPT